MASTMRVKERSGAWRQLSVGDAVTEAYRHLQAGDSESALSLMEKAVQYAPRVPACLYLLGVAQLRQNKYESAISSLSRAVRLDEKNADYLVSLGEALMPEKPLEAIDYLTRAVELGTRTPEAYAKLAMLLCDQQKPDAQKPEEALRVCDLGLTRCGAHARIVASRAFALLSLARTAEALECLRIAESALPDDLSTLLGLGSVLMGLNRVAEARGYLRRALRMEPDSAEAHFSLGILLLLEGDYQQGFREYEWRWKIRQLKGRKSNFLGPVWDGSELQGRRVLLHPEQGAGDIIQFARYAGFVHSRGGRVVFLVPPELVRLLSWLPGCEVSILGGAVPVTYNVHCPLLTLPVLAGTDQHSIPAPIPFPVPAQMKQKWSGVLGERPGGEKTRRVGLVWAGNPSHRNDRNRSLACRLFAPLFGIPGLQWFSLQVGSAVVQLADPGIAGKVRDLAPELIDYAETAGAISQLDLVITADTSVAHLAGSLGKPVWVLVPFAPDWRWLLDRSDSPWYPSMRLFRQPAVADWTSVMQEVAAALGSAL